MKGVIAPLIFALVCAAPIQVLADPAISKAAETADLSGYWDFETGVFDGVCRLYGEAVLHGTDDADVFIGEMTAKQTCVGMAQEIVAEQTITARRSGGDVRIIAECGPLPRRYLTRRTISSSPSSIPA